MEQRDLAMKSIACYPSPAIGRGVLCNSNVDTMTGREIATQRKPMILAEVAAGCGATVDEIEGLAVFSAEQLEAYTAKTLLIGINAYIEQRGKKLVPIQFSTLSEPILPPHLRAHVEIV